jgi:hypothetical protein
MVDCCLGYSLDERVQMDICDPILRILGNLVLKFDLIDTPCVKLIHKFAVLAHSLLGLTLDFFVFDVLDQLVHLVHSVLVYVEERQLCQFELLEGLVVFVFLSLFEDSVADA